MADCHEYGCVRKHRKPVTAKTEHIFEERHYVDDWGTPIPDALVQVFIDRLLQPPPPPKPSAAEWAAMMRATREDEARRERALRWVRAVREVRERKAHAAAAPARRLVSL